MALSTKPKAKVQALVKKEEEDQENVGNDFVEGTKVDNKIDLSD